MSNTAKKDIEFQITVETRLAMWIAERWGGLVAPKKPGKDYGKDAVIYRPHKIEFKCDYKADETGNIFLETYNPYRKDASGLTATKAHWWFIYIPSRAMAICFCPSRMLSHLTEHPEWKCPKTVGDNNSTGYIVPISDVVRLPGVTLHEGIML